MPDLSVHDSSPARAARRCKALINGREEPNQFVEELDVQLDSCQTILMSGGT